ncbi:MAG: Ppx/GppA family phosphatase [Actinomycetota bacterium]|nr:Ppx/GppA family phosphatase [Actinomycetota bacterium]MDQ5808005.1 Ppx/GppA family phosphatase [Actinomycetota bacterium]
MRVAVVDIGTNSTRLLIATVENGRVVEELQRESRVTRLGQGVDATGALAQDAMDRVFAVLDDYTHAIEELQVEKTTAVLTSAVRDASNGAQFTQEVRDRYGLEGRTIPGAEEAALTFLGATSERDPSDDAGEAVVIDIGGGSTEIVVGRGQDVSFFVSMQVGVVRHTERHLESDPPAPDELTSLAEEVAAMIAEDVPRDVLERAQTAIAVAGTATSCAAIDLALDPYDPDAVHGHRMPLARLDELLARLAQMPNEQRRDVVGLHPDRAPTIVAGVAILIEVLRAFHLEEVEVSEHDILRGAALRL